MEMVEWRKCQNQAMKQLLVSGSVLLQGGGIRDVTNSVVQVLGLQVLQGTHLPTAKGSRARTVARCCHCERMQTLIQHTPVQIVLRALIAIRDDGNRDVKVRKNSSRTPPIASTAALVASCLSYTRVRGCAHT